MINVPNPINQSGTVSGFTSATWATSQATQNVNNGKLYVVTGKGGTQPAAVDVHTASRPFSFLYTGPQNIQTLPGLNANGVLPYVPRNNYAIGTRKGVTVLAGQASDYVQVKTSWSVPAGADTADPNNVAAALLAQASLLVQIAQGIVDTAITGIG